LLALFGWLEKKVVADAHAVVDLLLEKKNSAEIGRLGVLPGPKQFRP